MSIARSSLFFAAGTLISRVFGLIRDMVVTHILGAGALHDAFVVAQRIPNLLRDMLAEGAMGSSFTKVYTGLRESDPLAAERLLFQMLYLCMLVMVGLSALGIWAAPQLVAIMSLGSATTATYQQNAVSLTQILFPSLGMSVIGAIAMGALYQKGRFFFNAIIPVLANLGVIAGGVFFGDLLQRFFPEWVAASGDARVLGLAWGTILGFMLQSGAAVWSVWPSLRKVAASLLLEKPWSKDIGHVLRLMGPAVIATSAAPINSIINTNFASSVGPGAVTWLTYAFRILQLPIGIFGVAVGVYALPSLTRAVIKAGKRVDGDVSAQLQQACIFVSWLLFPCMMFALVHHHRIISLLFKHGHYSEQDVTATGQALFAYAFSMVAYGLIKVLTSFYYATDRTSFAMKVSLASIAINFISNFTLVRHLGHTGLALTSSVTLSINAIVLLWGSWRMGVKWHKATISRHLLWLWAASSIFLIASIFNEGIAQVIGALIEPARIGLEAYFGSAQSAGAAPETGLEILTSTIDKLSTLSFLIYSAAVLGGAFAFCGMKAYGRNWTQLAGRLRRRS